MRVVIDGRFIRDDDTAAGLVHNVLQAWRNEARFEQIHLVLEPGTDLDVPDSVHIHSLRIPTSAFGRLARRRRLTRLCRRMRGEVLLTIASSEDTARHRFPHIVLVHALPVARNVKGFRAVDATVCLSDRIKQELLAYSPELINRPCWVIAPPAAASLEPMATRTLAVNESHQAGISSQLTLIDDALALQLGHELYAWHEVAGRLRLALVDTVARASWRARQFKLPDLVPVATPVVVPQSTGFRIAPTRAAVGRRHASISSRAVVVGALGALALSAVSAASVVIATAPPANVPSHHVVSTPTATGATATNPTTQVRSSTTPTTSSAPAATAPTATSSASSASSTTTTTMLPVIVLPKSASLPSVAPKSLLPIPSLPTVTVPSISVPTLPLPISLCLGSTTTTSTSQPGLSLPSLCNLSLTGLLGLKTP
ncbi:MAG TPA: hypothetical protein VGG38_06985 [Acidimicrobiales bacterium]